MKSRVYCCITHLIVKYLYITWNVWQLLVRDALQHELAVKPPEINEKKSVLCVFKSIFSFKRIKFCLRVKSGRF